MKSILLVTFVVVAALIISLMVRLGSFKTVEITEADRPMVKVIYKHHVGAYHKIVPVIEEVETWAKANGEPCEFSFGEYYDDPDVVAEDRMRSNGGCIVKAQPAAQMPDGFKYREVPAHRYVVGNFDGAPSIGPIKVYPKAKEYIQTHELVLVPPTFEVYQLLPNEKVHTSYYFPVVKKGESDTTPVGEHP